MRTKWTLAVLLEAVLVNIVPRADADANVPHYRTC